MAFYTPRGLKLRFSTPYAFSLMARLFPEVTPFKVLKKTEAIENLSDILPVLTAFALIFFFPDVTIWGICRALTIAWVIGYIMRVTGFFFIPFIVPLSELFSYIHGRGIITIIIGGSGYFLIGLPKTATILGVFLILNFIVESIAEMLRAILIRYTKRDYLSTSELAFLNAFKMLAAGINADTDIFVSESEIATDAWLEPHSWLRSNYPEILVE